MRCTLVQAFPFLYTKGHFSPCKATLCCALFALAGVAAFYKSFHSTVTQELDTLLCPSLDSINFDWAKRTKFQVAGECVPGGDAYRVNPQDLQYTCGADGKIRVSLDGQEIDMSGSVAPNICGGETWAAKDWQKRTKDLLYNLEDDGDKFINDTHNFLRG